MRFLRKLFEWIKATPRIPQKQWTPDLNPIDIRKISSELNLKAEGHRLGVAGVPHETDQSLSGPEAAAVHRIEEARQDYVKWGELRLGSLNADLARTDITQQINKARTADEEFERLASTQLTAEQAILRDLGEVARSRRDELSAFKRDNGLTRLPIVPTRTKKLLIIVIAFLLVGVDALFNMWFFAKGLNTGLVGGFIEAAMLAAANVSVNFSLGAYGVRYVHDVRLLPKIGGLGAIAAAAVIILTVALGIAHYRDALVLGADDAMTLALQTFKESPTALKEMSSWLLFFVTVLFGIVAVFDGYKMDDPYPGYGKKFRVADEAIQDYNAEIDALRDDLEDLKKEMLKQIDHAANYVESSVAIYKSLIGDKQRAGHDLLNAVNGAENALHALLQEFRDENKIARGSTPPPSYFNTWPQLRTLKMPDFDTSSDEDNLALQSQLLNTFVGEVQNIRARIQNAFNSRFNSLQTLDAHFLQSAQPAAENHASSPSVIPPVADQMSNQGI